jgi:hypothetical protein
MTELISCMASTRTLNWRLLSDVGEDSCFIDIKNTAALDLGYRLHEGSLLRRLGLPRLGFSWWHGFPFCQN